MSVVRQPPPDNHRRMQNGGFRARFVGVAVTCEAAVHLATRERAVATSISRLALRSSGEEASKGNKKRSRHSTGTYKTRASHCRLILACRPFCIFESGYFFGWPKDIEIYRHSVFRLYQVVPASMYKNNKKVRSRLHLSWLQVWARIDRDQKVRNMFGAFEVCFFGQIWLTYQCHLRHFSLLLRVPFLFLSPSAISIFDFLLG